MYHVVKTGESIDYISKIYKTTKQEIYDANTHISNFDSLAPGTKLFIELLNDDVKSSYEDAKPYIENYYKKNTSKDKYKEQKEEFKNTVVNEQQKEDILVEEQAKESENVNTDIIKENLKEVEKVETKEVKTDENSNYIYGVVDENYLYYDIYTNKYYYRIRPR